MNNENIENLQLAETAGASPEVHLSSRYANKPNAVVPEGYVLIKQQPDAEILNRMRDLINNLIDSDVSSTNIAILVYNLILGDAPKHNQD